MDTAKLAIIRAVRDMARADGRLHQQERTVLRIIALAEQLTDEEKQYLMRVTEPLDLAELSELLTERADRVRVLELSVLVGMADGVETPEETERLQQLTEQLGLSKTEVAGALERARDRFFDLTRDWEKEGKA